MYTGLAKEETSVGERQSLADERSERRTGALSILIVDEERLFCEILCEVLERQGHIATCCSSSLEALEKARSGTFDAVVLDVNMPEMPGPEALEILRRALPESPLTLIMRADRAGLVHAPIAQSCLPCVFRPLSISQTAGVTESISVDRRGHRRQC